MKKDRRACPFTDRRNIDLVGGVLDPLGTRKEVEYVRTILKNGVSADRQLSCFEKTGSMKSVVDQLGAETLEGI